MNFMGYKRPDGRVGIRNHVAVIAAMDNVNNIVRNIATQVKDVMPLTIWYGRGQYGADEELTFRTLAGMGANPNLHSVLIISLEPVSAKKLAKAIMELSGKRVEIVTVQECGNSINATAAGVEIAMDMVTQASEQQRELVGFDKLVLAVECGGSDTTSGIGSNPVLGKVADWVIDNGGTVVLSETSEFLGAEHILSGRAVNEDVRQKILSIVNNVEAQATARGVSILGANPVPDNIAGGLTTIEEKSLGAIIKGGSKPIQGVLEYAEPPRGTGLYLMDTPAPALESMTGLAAGGVQVILFSTGKGNIVGCPICPTAKITANPVTAKRMAPNIDLDVCDVFYGNITAEEGADPLRDLVVRICNGRKTRAEILGNEDIALNRIQPTV
ncbi:UxaA family hydrolase [Desulfosporosinus burensis]